MFCFSDAALEIADAGAEDLGARALVGSTGPFAPCGARTMATSPEAVGSVEPARGERLDERHAAGQRHRARARAPRPSRTPAGCGTARPRR